MLITLSGEEIILLSEKGIFWPAKKILIISDIHLGKAAFFRKQGIPIPEGLMQEDLLRLEHLIVKYSPNRCIIVGDLIHAKLGLSMETVSLFRSWIRKVKIDLDLVIGNHDRALKKQLPDGWHLNCHDDKLLVPPFVFKHFPNPDPDGFVWSGHLHPAAAIKYGGSKIKLPCFIIGENVGILPAFGSMISHMIVNTQKNERVFPIFGEIVQQLK